MHFVEYGQILWKTKLMSVKCIRHKMVQWHTTYLVYKNCIKYIICIKIKLQYGKLEIVY